MEIGIKIKALRLKNNLTQEELADRCELTKGYISQLENDLVNPSVETLSDILVALGTDLGNFFQNEESGPIVFKKKDYVSKDYGDSVTTWLVPSAQKNEMEPILLTLNERVQKKQICLTKVKNLVMFLRVRLNYLSGRKHSPYQKAKHFITKQTKNIH